MEYAHCMNWQHLKFSAMVIIFKIHARMDQNKKSKRQNQIKPSLEGKIQIFSIAFDLIATNQTFPHFGFLLVLFEEIDQVIKNYHKYFMIFCNLYSGIKNLCFAYL